MKEIIKLFKEFQYKYTLWDVFSDFLELSAISISNSIIKDKAKENRYFQIIKKYQPKDLDNFAKILICYNSNISLFSNRIRKRL